MRLFEAAVIGGTGDGRGPSSVDQSSQAVMLTSTDPNT